ncbi:aminopeptidase [Nitrolancea hollandica]|uniref:Peptidase M29 aminopeptidase II n=1 Tax=Nitrolancea hollandica Lb TaxID=1129897 RepID=I4EJJ8_9BACT|nr:aminopeptidase [Nitrolancea hollandica]CCF84860.1 Peptidase M29 aminopeptidase II [Nitrolancea hollandica Lb]
MADARIENLAKVLVDYSLDVQPGKLVVIAGTTLADPLIRAAYRRILARGAYPAVQVALPELNVDFFRLANDDQLQYITPDERLIPEQTDYTLRIMSDANTKALTSVNPERQQIAQRARAELRQKYLLRAADGLLTWCLTILPTNAYAQDAGMSLEDYADFIFRAGYLDSDDPVAAWQAMSREQERLIEWLSGKREVHVTAPDTDLTISIAGRTFINADGHRNFPDGEVFTGPVEDSANGHVRFSFPSIMGGREVKDIRLWFENGKVVRATAAENEEFLHHMLDVDEGARYLGEFAFGTNRRINRFTGNILLDEKIGGTMHMAIGASYPQTGGLNKSAVHWDMICDLRQQSEVTVDGQLFIKNGEFVV